MSDAPALTTAIYCRLSRNDPASVSIDQQRQTCTDYANQRGWTISQVYVDDGISAYRDVQRPAFENMLSDLAGVDCIIVRDIDRISRKGWRDPTIGQILDAGVQLVSVNQQIDTTTPAGELVLGVLLSIARQEAETKSRRQRDANLVRARRGHIISSHRRPFGYVDDRYSAVNDDEAAAIQDVIRALLTEGISMGKAAHMLNERGLHTSQGNEWTAVTISNYLRSPRLAGLQVYKGETFIPEAQTWPAIITVEQHHAIKGLRSKRDRTAPTSRPFQSLAVCCCGKPMDYTETKGYGYLRCSAKRYGTAAIEASKQFHPASVANGIRYDLLSDYMEGVITKAQARVFDKYADSTPTTHAELNEALQVATKRLDAARAKQTELMSDYYSVGTTMTREQFDANHAALSDAIEQAEQLLLQVERQQRIASTFGEDSHRWVPMPDDDEARAAHLIESIEVRPATEGKNIRRRVKVTLTEIAQP